jgi:aminoglycoside phosphotransferase (APT) family kinase protein
MLETIVVRPDERFSVASVVAFLRSAGISGFDPDDMQVEQFPAGHSNLTYLLRSGGWEAVLRRPPLGPVAPRAHDMPREFHLLQRLHPRFPLAPEPYVLCEDPGVIGAPFYVMERRRGQVLDQQFPPGWRPSRELHRAIAESLVRVLVDLHAVDWKAAGLDAIGHPEGYMQRQVTGWIDRYQRAQTDQTQPIGPLASWLSTGLPESPPATVIHNDYKLNNLLLDSQDPRRITAVLDWEMATVGDPLSDLASLLVYWAEEGESEMMGGLKAVTVSPGFPRRDEIVQLYASASGRDVRSLDWYLAFAYFKVGVISQQIYYRWYRGQTHDERFSGHGRTATNLVRKAAGVAGVDL